MLKLTLQGKENQVSVSFIFFSKNNKKIKKF